MTSPGRPRCADATISSMPPPRMPSASTTEPLTRTDPCRSRPQRLDLAPSVVSGALRQRRQRRVDAAASGLRAICRRRRGRRRSTRSGPRRSARVAPRGGRAAPGTPGSVAQAERPPCAASRAEAVVGCRAAPPARAACASRRACRRRAAREAGPAAPRLGARRARGVRSASAVARRSLRCAVRLGAVHAAPAAARALGEERVAQRASAPSAATHHTVPSRSASAARPRRRRPGVEDHQRDVVGGSAVDARAARRRRRRPRAPHAGQRVAAPGGGSSPIATPALTPCRSGSGRRSARTPRCPRPGRARPARVRTARASR